MIDVEHLSKYYGEFRALNDISFHIDKGEIVGFLGPNGAGKTTTMRILTSYLPPSEGQASIAGLDVFEDSLQVRKRIGYMPESVPLYTEMSVRAYLDYMASLRRTPNRKQAVERAMTACHIDDRADSLISKLSKGLRQRVGLAQAIVHEPEVLILDEPTIGLDPKQIIDVRELIRDLGREHTIILSSHILPEVSQTCSRILIINNGQIVAEGSPDELNARLQGAKHIFVQVAPSTPEANTGQVAALLGQVEGVTQVLPENSGFQVVCDAQVDVRPRLAQAVVGRGWDLLELRAVSMSLEDIFLKLTAEETWPGEEGTDA
jgi:ABC-2 type transport system ATP-binding protein